MNTLSFETGLQTFDLNGRCTVGFNPTDSAFVEKLFSAFDTLDSRQDGYKDEVEKARGTREIFEVARRRDAEMREIINGVFGADVCTPLFGEMNVYALAGGLPVWCNLMLAVMDEIDTVFAREQKAANPRIAKYTQKYRK